MTLAIRDQDNIEKGISIGRKQGMELGRKQGMEQGMKLGHTQGMEQGRKQGMEQGRRQIILSMLQKNLDEQSILLYCDITSEELAACRKELQAAK